MKRFNYIRYDSMGNTYYTDEACEFGKKIFDTIRRVSEEFIEANDCDYKINM